MRKIDQTIILKIPVGTNESCMLRRENDFLTNKERKSQTTYYKQTHTPDHPFQMYAHLQTKTCMDEDVHLQLLQEGEVIKKTGIHRGNVVSGQISTKEAREG